MADIKRYPSIPAKTLAADLSSSGSVIKITDILDWNGETLTASVFSDYIPATLINDAKTKVEFVLLTASTIGNATTTGITIYKRGLKYYAEGDSSDIDEVAANKLDWTAGETKLLLGTNAPFMYGRFPSKDNEETITEEWTFTQPNLPRVDSDDDPTDDEQFASKGYVDRQATGDAVVNRIVVSGHAGETVAAGEIIYQKSADGEWYLADTSAASTSENVLLGVAQGAGEDGELIAGGILLQGQDSNQAGLTAKTKQYLSDTAGELSESAGTMEVELGYSHPTDATKFIFCPRFDKFLTEDQQDALAGTRGTINTSNKYLTECDASVSGYEISQTTQDSSIAVGEADATSKANSVLQTFLATKNSITGVVLNKQANTGTFTGNVIIELFAADDDDEPTGSALATETILNATYDALSTGAFTATFDTEYTAAVSGNKYCIKVSCSTADNSNHINLGTNSAGGYSSGKLRYNNTTDGWVDGTGDLYFEITGSVISRIVRARETGKISEVYLQTTDANVASLIGGESSAVDLLHTHIKNIKEKFTQYIFNASAFNKMSSSAIIGSGNDEDFVEGSLVLTVTGNAGGTGKKHFYTPEIMSSANDFELRLKARMDGTSASDKLFFGIVDYTAGTENNEDSITQGAGIMIKGDGNIFSWNGNGSNRTKTSIGSGITVGNFNGYTIKRVGASIYFYINGTLVATHTTYLPTDTTTGFVLQNGTSNSASVRMTIIRESIDFRCDI